MRLQQNAPRPITHGATDPGDPLRADRYAGGRSYGAPYLKHGAAVSGRKRATHPRSGLVPGLVGLLRTARLRLIGQ